MPVERPLRLDELPAMVEEAWRTGQPLSFRVVACICELDGLPNTTCPTHGRPEEPIRVDAVAEDVAAVTAGQLISMLLELEPNTRVWFEDDFGIKYAVGRSMTRPSPDAMDLGWAQLEGRQVL